MLLIDEKRLLGALDELAGIGAIDGGGCARLALTDEDKAGRDLVVGWMKAAGEAGSIPLIRWTALLSLYLGVFNLLPIPALDGSRLAFIAFEAIRGRPVDPNKESLVHFVGFALLMMLMLVVTHNDIMRVFFSG